MPFATIESKIVERLLSNLRANTEIDKEFTDKIENLMKEGPLTDAEQVLRILKDEDGVEK